MGEVILEKEEVLKVYFVCATAVQLQLFSFADLFLCFGQKMENSVTSLPCLDDSKYPGAVFICYFELVLGCQTTIFASRYLLRVH